ncbi:uncharacterized protein LOC119066668 [Bradysia coprophila]|uniref:uncharacterized protein LOC119066668 n=1 Tax=Bradysia coprophila TaxID=38358 RepID=UPI00187DCB61|nr:uncharacterized protein LOC119066668 [Bradysia coprophila]
MLLPKQSGILFSIFRFIGIAPYTRNTNIQYSRKIGHLIPTLLSPILSLCLTVFLFIFPHFKSLGPVHTIINFSHIWSIYFAIFSANYQCYFSTSAYRKANYRIRQIGKRFSEKSARKHIYRFQRCYKIKILIIFILFFGSQGLVFIEVWVMSMDSGLWSSLTASLVISSLRILYPIHISHTILYADILALFIKSVNIQAQNPTICSTSSQFLRNIKSFHMELWKLTVEINDFFGIHLVFVIINSFIYNLYQMYWLFMAFQLNWGLLAVVDGFVSLLYGSVSLFTLVESCQSSKLEINLLVQNIEQIIFWTNDNLHLHQLKQEVLHQINVLPICISANQYFTIDRNFLATITAGCCMYILIFVQFFLTVKE